MDTFTGCNSAFAGHQWFTANEGGDGDAQWGGQHSYHDAVGAYRSTTLQEETGRDAQWGGQHSYHDAVGAYRSTTLQEETGGTPITSIRDDSQTTVSPAGRADNAAGYSEPAVIRDDSETTVSPPGRAGSATGHNAPAVRTDGQGDRQQHMSRALARPESAYPVPRPAMPPPDWGCKSRASQPERATILRNIRELRQRSAECSAQHPALTALESMLELLEELVQALPTEQGRMCRPRSVPEYPTQMSSNHTRQCRLGETQVEVLEDRVLAQSAGHQRRTSRKRPIPEDRTRESSKCSVSRQRRRAEGSGATYPATASMAYHIFVCNETEATKRGGLLTVRGLKATLAALDPGHEQGSARADLLREILEQTRFGSSTLNDERTVLTNTTDCRWLAVRFCELFGGTAESIAGHISNEGLRTLLGGFPGTSVSKGNKDDKEQRLSAAVRAWTCARE